MSVLFVPGCENVVLIVVCNRLPTGREYLDLNWDISVSSLPVMHGLTKIGSVYESAVYSLRNNVTERELLFFVDVEPDSMPSKPQTINVWKAAAPKILHTLASIFKLQGRGSPPVAARPVGLGSALDHVDFLRA